MAEPITTIKSGSNRYLCAELDFTVVADREHAGPWEQWTVCVQDDDRVALRSAHGKYLTAEADLTVTCNRDAVGPWELWTVIVQDGATVAFQSVHGTFLCLTPDGDVFGDRTAIGPWETVTVDPVWWGSAGTATPLQGEVLAEFDGGTRDETGPRLPILCHAGDLLIRYREEPAKAIAFLDEIAAAGYHGVRTWTVLRGSYWQGWFHGEELTPDQEGYWDLVRDFARHLTARGLRWLISQGDLQAWTSDQNAREKFMRELAEVVNNEGGLNTLVFGVDCGNETWQNGEADPQRLMESLDAFVAICPAAIRTLTSPQAEEGANEFVMEGVLRDIHSSRGPWPKPARRVFNIGYEATPHIWTVQSEGPGQGVQEYAGDNRPGHHVSATDVPEEWNDGDPEIVGVLAAIHAIGKATYVYFCSPGVISDEPFGNYAAFARMPALYRMLPQDIGAWWTFHGGDGRSFSNDRILGVPTDDNLEVRSDHAAPHGGDQRICIIYGREGTYTVKVINNFDGVIIHPGTLESTPLQLTKGADFHATFKRGRILLGRIW